MEAFPEVLPVHWVKEDRLLFLELYHENYGKVGRTSVLKTKSKLWVKFSLLNYFTSQNNIFKENFKKKKKMPIVEVDEFDICSKKARRKNPRSLEL